MEYMNIKIKTDNFTRYFDKKHRFLFIIVAVMLLGVYFRIYAYLSVKTLWLDECMLFQNIYERTYFGMFSALSYAQTAPPLFLITEKFICNMFGIKELVLRFFPFLCSLISIPVFYFFSKNFLNEKLTLIIANILFCCNIQLIRYGCELKQYSSDVLCFMILFILLNKLTIKDFDKKKLLFYSIISVIFPLMSMPSYFLFGALFFTELIIHKGKYLKVLTLSQIPLLLITFFYVPNVMLPQYSTMINLNMWQRRFLSTEISKNIILLRQNLFFFFQPLHLMLQSILLFIGIGFFIKDYKQKQVMLLSFAIGIMIICSLLKIYPLYERTVLFSVPFLIVFLTKPVDYVMKKKNVLSLFIAVIFVLSFHSFGKYKLPYKPACWTNPKELTQILMSIYSEGDTIVVNRSSKSEYFYYKKYYNFNPDREIYVANEDKNEEEYLKELEKVTQKNKKYIFFYTCDYFKGKVKNSLKEWKERHNVLYEKEIASSYILYLQK